MTGNKVDYFEVGTPDRAASQAFYGGLFGWEFGGAQGSEYSTVNGAEGGMWETTGMGGTNWGIFYVHVDDVPAAIEHAVELGATVAIPMVDNGQIQFAHLVDPHGNRFGVWKPKE